MPFPHACVGSFSDEPLLLSNPSYCTLTVRAITSSAADFVVAEVFTYPLTIAPGGFLPVPIRFAPTSFGAKTGTINVDSDDPASPATIAVSGHLPSGKIAVTGSTIFGGVPCCTRVQHTISICNVGACPLHVSHVGFRHKRRHYRLINNPFPATLHPGSCLGIVIQYTAKERVARGCELEIKSDDPHEPVKHVEVLAYTIWDCCCGGEQSKCCGKAEYGCGKGCRKECCDEDNDEDDDDED